MFVEGRLATVFVPKTTPRLISYRILRIILLWLKREDHFVAVFSKITGKSTPANPLEHLI
jgi:hypothetical protein